MRCSVSRRRRFVSFDRERSSSSRVKGNERIEQLALFVKDRARTAGEGRDMCVSVSKEISLFICGRMNGGDEVDRVEAVAGDQREGVIRGR